VDDRRAGPEVVAGVLAGDRVDEFGRSLPRLVASAMAALTCCFIQIWLRRPAP
jgi:hypothetical protein